MDEDILSQFEAIVMEQNKKETRETKGASEKNKGKAEKP